MLYKSLIFLAEIRLPEMKAAGIHCLGKTKFSVPREHGLADQNSQAQSLEALYTNISLHSLKKFY